MVVLLYHAQTVGPVCRDIAAQAPGHLAYHRDTQARDLSRDIVVRWGSILETPMRMQINTAKAVGIAQDKAESRRKLGDLSPATWFKYSDPITYPCVVRPVKHFGGNRFHLCRTPAEMLRAVKRCGLRYYISAYHDKAKEYRVFTLHRRIIGVTERFPLDAKAYAWNHAMGGTAAQVKRKEWPIPVCMAALQATARVGLDFAAIDIIVNQDGTPYVLEVNTAPGLTKLYRQRQVAQALAWTNIHGVSANTGGQEWQHLLHPGLSE